ncbi:MAG: YfbM family protein [Gemmataceae bacterium]|nr:YfbM family protein [Gemmataceae bacterium]
MGCLGVFFALTPEQDKRLRKAHRQDGDEGVMEVIEEIEEAWDRKHLFETDKAWDPIHRGLTLDNTPRGKLDPTAGRKPLNLLILGGRLLYDGDDYTVNLITPAQVRRLAAALAKITEEWMRERFFQLKPKGCGYDIDEDEFDYTWGNFEGLPQFFARAAKEGRSVIFTVDH